MRLLIADDMASTRALVRSMVADQGFTIVEAADGDEAWRILTEADPPRVAILDWFMPGMDGIDVCKQLSTLTDHPFIYTIILTGNQAEDAIETSLASGAHDFIRKPAQAVELNSRIMAGRRLVETQDRLARTQQELEDANARLSVQMDACSRELEEKRNLLSSVFQVVNVGIALIDAEGRHIECNEKYRAIFACPMERLIGAEYFSFIREDDRETARIVHRGFMKASVESMPNEWSVVREDGTPLDVSVRAARLVSDSGTRYLVLALVDITHAKTMIEKQSFQERMLIQQSKLAAMGEMIGAIAHQWKQPLNALSLYVNDILDSYEYGQLDEKELRFIVRNANGLIDFMTHTIEDFSSFFKPEKEMRPFVLYKAVADTLQILSANLVKDNVHVQVSGSEELSAVGFVNEFKQVILNIVNNAKDAIIGHREKNKLAGYDYLGDVMVSIRDDGETVTVSIRDNGGGIAPEVLATLFEPYVTTKGEHGTGIGMYMAKRIIEEKMHGTITAGNIENGAQFDIRLPNPSTPKAG